MSFLGELIGFDFCGVVFNFDVFSLIDETAILEVLATIEMITKIVVVVDEAVGIRRRWEPHHHEVDAIGVPCSSMSSEMILEAEIAVVIAIVTMVPHSIWSVVVSIGGVRLTEVAAVVVATIMAVRIGIVSTVVVQIARWITANHPAGDADPRLRRRGDLRRDQDRASAPVVTETGDVTVAAGVVVIASVHRLR